MIDPLHAARSRQPVVLRLRGVQRDVYATVLTSDDVSVQVRIWGLKRTAVVPLRDVVSAAVVRLEHSDVRRISADQLRSAAKELSPWLD